MQIRNNKKLLEIKNNDLNNKLIVSHNTLTLKFQLKNQFLNNNISISYMSFVFNAYRISGIKIDFYSFFLITSISFGAH